MNKLEQYLKPPSNMNNSQEQIYNESQEGEEELNDYNQNEDNSYDNGNQIQNLENENYENNELQNSKNKILKNYQNEEDNNEIIQGINSFNNIRNKNINEDDNEKQYNQYDIINNDNNNENSQHNFANINENNNNNNARIQTNPDEIMNDLLFKIRKLKGSRTMKKSDITNTNEINLNNNFEILQRTIKNDKFKINKNEYIGKINMNNQIIQNNPKMKEVANLIKDYNNQDKNKNDNMQINFYNNNQINIVKPDVFFNMGNQKKQNNDENNYENSNNQNKYYISIIDGKAIVNGQRINVNSQYQSTPQNNNLFDRKINFNSNINNSNKYLFNFDNDRRSSFMENRKDTNFKLQNLKQNYRFNIIENIKNNNKLFSKINFFNKEFYKEELNKIDDSLFNMNNERYKIRK